MKKSSAIKLYGSLTSLLPRRNSKYRNERRDFCWFNEARVIIVLTCFISTIKWCILYRCDDDDKIDNEIVIPLYVFYFGCCSVVVCSHRSSLLAHIVVCCLKGSKWRSLDRFISFRPLVWQFNTTPNKSNWNVFIISKSLFGFYFSFDIQARLIEIPCV